MELSSYRITSQIYEGESSLVYRAHMISNNKPVIIKVLKDELPSPEKIAWFKREYQTTKSLNIRGVGRVLKLEKFSSKLAIILEDFGGKSFTEIKLAGQITIGQFLPLALKITQSLGQVHERQIIHKDINPSNIVWNQTTDEVKLIDFGISALISQENSAFSHPNLMEGTLAYISPEQTGRMNRSLDYRSDFYSLGVTFYQLLTGTLPFPSADPLEVVHCHIAKQPAPPQEIQPDIPPVMGDIILKLMAKNAEQRYQSAAGLKADLEECYHQWQENGNIASFTLAQRDITDKFQIPQKLYGRESEVSTLLAAGERVFAGGSSEMMLVAGYSGIGKSALVQEVHKSITGVHGYFIAGKFDQYQRNIPYSAFIQAFASLVRQLLAESSREIAAWREKLLAAFGPNGRVIIEVIPEVELIVGSQPELPALGPSETQNRFNLVFQNFIRVFCQKEHPLVIFLDDLQWADRASLNLMQILMTDPDSSYLLLIGAYRDNEVSPGHPLLLSLDTITTAGATINRLSLTPLQLPHLTQLLADTLNSSSAAVQPLAKLVLTKTGGNPFFAAEFLKSLHGESLINFNRDRSRWQWDLERIQQQKITDNVVELMAGKLQKLPEATQQILQIAACLGNQFDLETLGIAWEKSPRATAENLHPAVAAGFIIPLSDAYKLVEFSESSTSAVITFKFAHDRIQQATYSLIPEAHINPLHLHIGQLLLQHTPPEDLDANIFDIVNQLNFGSNLISTPEERNHLAELNLIAAKKAKAATAYQGALEYLTIGIELLPPQSWESNYNLTLKLHTTATNAAYLNGDHQQASELAETVLKHAQTILDKIPIYETQILFYISQTQMQEALDKGLAVLDLLKVDLISHPPDNLEIEAIYNLPEMTDPEKLAALRILIFVFPAAFLAKPELYPTLVFTVMQLSLNYGNSPLSANAYAAHGLISCGFFHQIELGYQFGQLALELVEKYPTPIKCRVVNLFNGFIRHWKDSVQPALPILRQNVQLARESGDLEYAGFSSFEYCCRIWFLQDSLVTANEEIKNYLNFVASIKQEWQLFAIKIWAQFALNLTGKAAVKVQQLTGEQLDETEIIPVWESTSNLSLLFFAYLAKTMLSYTFKDYDSARESAETGAKYAIAAASHLLWCQHYLFHSLAHLALYPTATTEAQAEYLKTVDANQAQMQMWATHAPMNFQHKYDLVAAEKARVLGQIVTAMELYDQAISGASASGYIQEEALAWELAAEFYLSLGREEIARTYMTKAHYTYYRWGATAKVEDLEARYPQLISRWATAGSSFSPSANATTSTKSGAGETIDLTSVLKASQAIASEIHLDKLLAGLMTILMENAGAQKGFLILSHQGDLLLEIWGEVDTAGIQVYPHLPLNSGNIVNGAIVNYVARTKEDVVLADANREGIFTADPYIKTNQSQSVLCAPILNQGQLIGILYLENNLTTGAFTPKRLEILKILSAQAAVSLENAQLYRTLEQKVQERTAQLAAANQEIQALNTMLKAENLRMSAELDVTRRLQQMILPKEAELSQIPGLEIAGFMEPAAEVGGDYYDVLQQDGKVKIGIGDVTGHGLESGMLMIMAQMAVRTLLKNNVTDPVQFLSVLNSAIYDNVSRMNTDKNMTLSLLDYADGTFTLSGQHEEVILVRHGGIVESLDTIDLGFPIGLDADITDFLSQTQISLAPGEALVLYTDGITEAENMAGVQYGLARLCEVVRQNWQLSAHEIQAQVIADLRHHIGAQTIYDDITLVVIKQKY
uniref:GAF domain-containing protein n=1 Tax=Planktothricoides sp. SpSt-374 TaxID=2282167 RepID=A0A7C3ZY31_9CYAN